MAYRIYKAREIDINARGWIVEFDRLDMPEVSDPDMRWTFKTRKVAERFANLVESGMTPQQAIKELKKPTSGTAPDTSLFLGDKRKDWLAQQGGIQPTIRRLIDQAMQEGYSDFHVDSS